MKMMHAGNGSVFATLSQVSEEFADFLEPGTWIASPVGWHRDDGSKPTAEGRTAREAWDKLAREVGPLTPHDDATTQALAQ